jgi:hypothetical protein
MIDQALLDFIDTHTDACDPAQVHVRDWAARVRELRKRQSELLEKQRELLDAADAAAAEFDSVSAELASLCHRQQEVLSRVCPSTETKQ